MWPSWRERRLPIGLAMEHSDPNELEKALVFLHDAGVQRFILLLDLPGEDKAKSKVLLPWPPSAESSAFGFVNHTRSFSWGNLPFSTSPLVQSERGRRFVTFFEGRSALETSLFEAAGSTSRMERLVSIIQRSDDALNRKDNPTSFGLCPANGACLGNQVIVSAGPNLKGGRVLGPGFPGDETRSTVSLQIAVEKPRLSEHQFFLKQEVAE